MPTMQTSAGTDATGQVHRFFADPDATIARRYAFVWLADLPTIAGGSSP